jgi:molybdate-binding protein
MSNLSALLLACCCTLLSFVQAADESFTILAHREAVDHPTMRKRQSGIDNSELGKSEDLWT